MNNIVEIIFNIYNVKKTILKLIAIKINVIYFNVYMIINYKLNKKNNFVYGIKLLHINIH